MTLEKKIILQLIEKYENSKNFLEDSSRRVALKASDLKGYMKNAEEKSRYHDAIYALKTRKFIDIEWVTFEEGNLLNRIILNLKMLDIIYDVYGYLPKMEKLKAAYHDLDAIDNQMFPQELRRDIKLSLDKGRFHKYWPEEAAKRKDLLQVFSAIDEIDEMTERLFSLKYFSDSKYFEKKIKSRLISIIKTYHSKDLEDHEILESYGITQNPYEILLCGHLEIKLDHWIDLSVFPYGSSINKTTIDHIKGLRVHSKKIITIENKAVYYEFIKRKQADELVIYLGGFFGKSTRKFLSYINQSIKDTSIYHWSDIDLGGFRIFDYLDSHLDIDLIPLNMDLIDLKNHMVYGQSFDGLYEKKLRQYLDTNLDTCFKEVIEFMLDKKIRLEQEAFYM